MSPGRRHERFDGLLEELLAAKLHPELTQFVSNNLVPGSCLGAVDLAGTVGKLFGQPGHIPLRDIPVVAV